MTRVFAVKRNASWTCRRSQLTVLRGNPHAFHRNWILLKECSVLFLFAETESRRTLESRRRRPKQIRSTHGLVCRAMYLSAHSPGAPPSPRRATTHPRAPRHHCCRLAERSEHVHHARKSFPLFQHVTCTHCSTATFDPHLTYVWVSSSTSFPDGC